MSTKAHIALLALLPLLTLAGCIEEDEAFDDTQLRFSLKPVFQPLIKPFNGHWEGSMIQVDGISQNDYEATLQFAPAVCTVSGEDIYRGEWDYFHHGVTCTSELDLLGVSIGVDGAKTWTFYDHNLTGPCTDGYATMTETDDPSIMWHTWSDLDFNLDAEGPVTRQSICGNGG